MANVNLKLNFVHILSNQSKVYEKQYWLSFKFNFCFWILLVNMKHIKNFNENGYNFASSNEYNFASSNEYNFAFSNEYNFAVSNGYNINLETNCSFT